MILEAEFSPGMPLAACVEINHVTGQHPGVNDIPDPAGLHTCARGRLFTVR